MGDRAAIGPMVEAAAAALGGLDVLVNNAGIGGPTAPVEAIDPDDWDGVLRVNITSMFDTSRLAIPHLRRSARGAIVNLSSVAGRFGYANRAAYATSKWGVIGFTRASRSSWTSRHPGQRDPARHGQGPRIDRVFQGRASLTGRTLEEERRLAMLNQSIPHMVDAADIAAMAVYLASEAARPSPARRSPSTTTSSGSSAVLRCRPLLQIAARRSAGARRSRAGGLTMMLASLRALGGTGASDVSYPWLFAVRRVISGLFQHG